MKKLFLILSIFLYITSLNAKQSSDSKYHYVRDMTGREVLLPKQIKTIINIGAVGVLNSFVMTMGEAEKIASGLPSSFRMPIWKYQFVFAPHIKELSSLRYGSNGGPDIEKLLEAKPDVIFMMAFHKEAALELASKGLNVVILNWRGEQDLRPLMDLLGDIFDKPSVATAYESFFKHTVSQAAKLTEDIPEDKKITTLFINVTSMRGPRLIAEWWIKAAGGKSIVEGRKSESITYDIEQILAKNPDVIIVAKKENIKELQNDKRLNTLKAVKDGKVYVTPTAAHTWANPTLEQPLMVLWALNKFYPDRYQEKELRKAVRHFYSTFFKTNLSEEQITEIISGNNT